MGSRGSVIPVFLEQKRNKIFTITDKNDKIQHYNESSSRFRNEMPK